MSTDKPISGLGIILEAERKHLEKQFAEGYRTPMEHATGKPGWDYYIGDDGFAVAWPDNSRQKDLGDA